MVNPYQSLDRKTTSFILYNPFKISADPLSMSFTGLIVFFKKIILTLNFIKKNSLELNHEKYTFKTAASILQDKLHRLDVQVVALVLIPNPAPKPTHQCVYIQTMCIYIQTYIKTHFSFINDIVWMQIVIRCSDHHTILV